MAREAVTVKEAEALVTRAKAWESSYNRLLQAADEIEAHGYVVTISITEVEDDSV